jgi:pantoate--beta-alanine ligase
LSPIITRKMDAFRTFYDFIQLKEHIKHFGAQLTVGLVPTMGALHQGHIALVERAAIENDIVVVTIFVNPKQFNNSSDLKKYPRTIETDIALLSRFNNVVVCIPEVNDVYPENDSYSPIKLGVLDEVLEGRYRPGHFPGVAHVVHNLFSFIEPTSAYFGLKDYQQFAVINEMVKQTKLEVKVEGCDTVRDKNGLALSSRNFNLNEEQINDALIIIETLRFIKNKLDQFEIDDVLEQAKVFFNKGKLTLEYLDIVDAQSFKRVTHLNQKSVCCIAAFCGEVRLIDNILL